MLKNTRANILKMSESKTLQLVYLYKKEECLWKRDSKSFTKKTERSEAYKRIATALDLPKFTAEHVRIKLKNLRNGYCQELRKIAAKGTQYKPTLVWFPLMDSFIRENLSKTSVKILMKDSQEKEDSSKTTEPIKEEWLTIEASEEEEEDYSIQNFNTPEPEAERPQIVNVKSFPETSQVDCESRSDSLAPANRDYFDDFGKYIASLLRTMPEKKALCLQPKIVNMITVALLDDD